MSGNLWVEEGPTLLLPNGNVFIVGGGTSNTALYSPTTNTWSAGPQIPYPYTADDAPGAVLPNGDVIFTADAALTNGQYTGPTGFFDYTPPSNGVGPGTITQLTGLNVPNDPAITFGGSYVDRFLVLPTGQLMFTDNYYNETWIGTPSGAPQPQWRPVVNSITGSGSVYTLTGLRLNGMDAGAAYGDDAEMDENYPIVRLTSGTGTVYYAMTSNWSNLGVATGSASETVTFTLPSGMPAGNYSLVVSGAGVDSFPVAFHLSSTAPSVALSAVGQGGRQSFGTDEASSAGYVAISGNYDEFSGLKVPPPSPAGFGETELGALPAALFGPIGSVADDLFTPVGSTPVDFANAVDTLLAGGGTAWWNSGSSRTKSGFSA